MCGKDEMEPELFDDRWSTIRTKEKPRHCVAVLNTRKRRQRYVVEIEIENHNSEIEDILLSVELPRIEKESSCMLLQRKRASQKYL